MEYGNLFSKLKDSYGTVYEEQNEACSQGSIGFNLSVGDNNRQAINQLVSNPIILKNKLTSVDIKINSVIKNLSRHSRVNESQFVNGLNKIVRYSSGQKQDVLKNRLLFIVEKARFMLPLVNKIIEISDNNLENAVFLFDNLNAINNIMLSKRVVIEYQYKLLDVLNEQNFNDFLRSANKDKFGINFVVDFIYSLTPHEIGCGDTSKKVDSSEIVSMLTGITSLSYLKTSSLKKFDDTVKSLIDVSFCNDNIHYSEIVEGILIQKPQLAKIAIAYQNLNAKWATWLDDYEDVIKKQEQFFNNLHEKGILPNEITLRTIIPDKNALKNPQNTVDLFYERMFC